MVILSKYSDSEHKSCFLVMLTSVGEKCFFAKFFSLAVEKSLIASLNTQDEAPQVFNYIHLQNKVEISSHGLQGLSGFKFNIHFQLSIWATFFTLFLLLCPPGLPGIAR